MNRLSIINEIGNLTEQSCRPCDKSPQTAKTNVKGGDYSIRMEHCKNVCPVGIKLQKLGDQLLQISSERRKKRKDEVKEVMAKNKTGPVEGLTKEVFLEQLAAGETISSIERAWKLKFNSLHYWVTKWELKGIDSNKARMILETHKAVDDGSKDVDRKPAGLPAINAAKESEQLQELASKLREKNAAYDQLLGLNKELNEKMEEMQVKLTEAMEGRDYWENVANTLTIERNDAFQSFQELEKEYELLKAKFEEASVVSVKTVNYETAAERKHHASHIDFIRSILTPEEFAGFCKGTAVEGVSRGGADDLRKAAVFLGWATT